MNVSVLVPWREEPGNPARQDAWRWIEARWEALTDYEIITGSDSGVPFSKTSAINDAFSRASGDVLILADADTWCTSRLAQACEVALDLDRLVIPWASSYRLSAGLSSLVTALPAATPDPWPAEARDTREYNPPPATAAMITVISRRAFIEVGGMDSRFRGWGREDTSFALACGVLLGRSIVLPGEAWSLYHHRPRNQEGRRVWSDDVGALNWEIAGRYRRAVRNRDAMRALCSEHPLRMAECG